MRGLFCRLSRLAPFIPTARELTCPVPRLQLIARSAFSSNAMTAALPSPPQQPPTWQQHTPETLLKNIKDAIAASRSVQDQVAAVKADQATFDNVVGRLADDEAKMDTVCDCLVFMRALPLSLSLYAHLDLS